MRIARLSLPAFVLLLTSAGACGQQLSQQNRTTVIAWLECEECLAGELDSVVAIGSRAIPTLGDVLLAGPSDRRMDSLRAALRSEHQELTAFAASRPGLPPLSSETDFVSTGVDNFVALQRKRAAVAIADIGGPTARPVLQQAVDSANAGRYRADVARAVRDAGARIGIP